MKTLLPDSFVINVLGGPGKEFQSGDDDGSTPWGSPSMTQGLREYLGWGRVEVRPTAVKNYDTFLNVIQFGDAKTLTAMSPIVRVDAGDKKMTGAHIKDSERQWVVLFAKNSSDVLQIRAASYAFAPVATTSEQLLVNMKPHTTYYITSGTGGSGTTVTVSASPEEGSIAIMSNDQGVLKFSLDGLTVGKDTTPPAPPVNLKVLRAQ